MGSAERAAGAGAAIVTGGASGIGRACVERLSRAGLRVAIADLDLAAAERAAAEIVAAGGEALAVEADVTDPDANADMIARTVERFGGLDSLVLNAGLATKPTPVQETTLAQFERVMAVNVTSVFLGAQAALEALKASGNASITITASVMGVRTRPGFSAYASAKAAAIHLASTLALEFAPHGIRVNCVAPVATDTPMLGTFIGDGDPDEGRKRFIASVPLGRLATPEDVAEAITWLASPGASFITGVVVPVDGGRAL